MNHTPEQMGRDVSYAILQNLIEHLEAQREDIRTKLTRARRQLRAQAIRNMDRSQNDG